ncbi:phosphotransferase family protein [Frankia sp. AgB32]|uniref:phosphotransferase family protein n=1 Tax=Frankia sp. AgB32 TaxID=631119 RepID=UPI00200E16EF|nr:phosphotransferase family protein [Frankia sp. AgB32]MCK9898292.1 phosphotransferase family protein [Frankia sp. AgB32]
MDGTDVRAHLEAWLRRQLPDAPDTRVEGLERVEFGYSAEMLILTLVQGRDGSEQRQDVVVRLRPTPPGLLEPYDLQRQFDIQRALEPTPVRAPRVLWAEQTGNVLGRPFYVMERLAGTVYESVVPPELSASPERVQRMSEGILDQVAAIHQVDLRATGLDALGDGRHYLDQELERWADNMHRWQRDTLPRLERLLAELRARQPAPCPTVTLIHGDPKPGNFAFVGDEVTGVFDWELAGVGDPLADIGWMELAWKLTPVFRGLPASHFDDLILRYQALTGITVEHRPWYRAFQAFKMSVILLVGAMLVDRGISNDVRIAQAAQGVPAVSGMGLREFGVTEKIPSGPVAAREERIREASATADDRSGATI